jgi:hypothetical protein
MVYPLSKHNERLSLRNGGTPAGMTVFSDVVQPVRPKVRMMVFNRFQSVAEGHCASRETEMRSVSGPRRFRRTDGPWFRGFIYPDKPVGFHFM